MRTDNRRTLTRSDETASIDGVICFILKARRGLVTSCSIEVYFIKYTVDEILIKWGC